MTSNHTLHASPGPLSLHSLRRVMVSPQMLSFLYRKLTAIFRMIHISCTIFPRHAQKHHKRHAKSSHQSYRPVQSRIARPHDSLTYQNRRIKQKKNPTQTFQPTPVFSAMRSIRFIVPRKRFLVPSNWSFIFSARAVESLISPPIAFVN